MQGTPNAFGDVFEAPGAPGVARLSWTAGLTTEFRGVVHGPALEPIPALVSDSFLDEFGLSVGDRVSVSVQNAIFDVTVAETAGYFPTLDPNERPFLVADLRAVLARANVGRFRGATHPNEAWLAVDSADAASAAELDLDQLAAEFFIPIDRSEMLANAEVDPLLSAGWRALLAVSFFTVLVVSAIGFTVHARVTFEARGRDLALLRTIGLSMRQLLTLVLLEHLLVVGAAAAIGVFAGARLGSTIMPYLANSGEGLRLVPPMVTEIDWGGFATAFGLFAAVFAVVVASLLIAVYRMSIHRVMRLGT